MQNRNSLVWFARGFMGTALIVLLVLPLVFPNTAWAQAFENFERQILPGQQTLDPGTDDPQTGVPPGPVPQDDGINTSDPVGAGDLLEPGTDGGPLAPTVKLDVQDPGVNTMPTVRPETQLAPGSDIAPQAVSGDYSSPMVIPAADFSSDGAQPDRTFFSFTEGYVRGTGAGQGCLKAPVYLPNGAILDYFYDYVYDNESTYTVTVTLDRVRNQTGVHDPMAAIASSGTSDQIQYLGTVPDTKTNTIDNEFSYYTTTCLYTLNTRLYAIRISYHMP